MTTLIKHENFDSSSKLCLLDGTTCGKSLGVRLGMVDFTKLIPLVVSILHSESTKTALCGG